MLKNNAYPLLEVRSLTLSSNHKLSLSATILEKGKWALNRRMKIVNIELDIHQLACISPSADALLLSHVIVLASAVAKLEEIAAFESLVCLKLTLKLNHRCNVDMAMINAYCDKSNITEKNLEIKSKTKNDLVNILNHVGCRPYITKISLTEEVSRVLAQYSSPPSIKAVEVPSVSFNPTIGPFPLLTELTWADSEACHWLPALLFLAPNLASFATRGTVNAGAILSCSRPPSLKSFDLSDLKQGSGVGNNLLELIWRCPLLTTSLETVSLSTIDECFLSRSSLLRSMTLLINFRSLSLCEKLSASERIPSSEFGCKI